MCTHSHYIFNHYVRKRVLVKCGKCVECLQSKADARANRIRHEVRSGYTAFFVTLTYDNKHVPFIDLSDLDGHDLDSGVLVPVYRDIDNYFVPIDYVYLDKFSSDFDVNKVNRLRRNKKCIDKPFVGICYYRDLQNYLKRVRITLQRKYGLHNIISYFGVSEYGETYRRPHFHLEVFCPTKFSEAVRSVLTSSWSMCSKDRLCRSVELARHPADYLASYVNSGSDISSFFKISSIRQKHSCSLGFGTHLFAFSLLEILKNSERNFIAYDYKPQGAKADVVTLPIPEYVINRFFPKFKGYSRIAPNTLANVLQRPTLIAEQLGKDNIRDEEIKAICVRLTNCFNRYRDEHLRFGMSDVSYEDYIYHYIKVRNALEVTRLRLWYQSMKKDLQAHELEYYDNVNELLCDKVHSDHTERYPVSVLERYENYNATPTKLKSCEEKTYKYHRRIKQRKDTNLIYGTISDNF